MMTQQGKQKMTTRVLAPATFGDGIKLVSIDANTEAFDIVGLGEGLRLSRAWAGARCAPFGEVSLSISILRRRAAVGPALLVRVTWRKHTRGDVSMLLSSKSVLEKVRSASRIEDLEIYRNVVVSMCEREFEPYRVWEQNSIL